MVASGTGSASAALTETAHDPAPSAAEEPAAGGERRRLDRLGPLAVAPAAILVLPVAVALAVLRHPPWLPLFDNALIELQVRDVGTARTPLLGLGGRLEGFGARGSHPGPLAFYVLAPVYRLLGADGWALLAAVGMVAAIGAVLAVGIAHRRGGWRLALVVTIVLGLLFRAYGAWRLVDPWNPHLPLVWWFVFLLAVWSVLCADWPLLPVAVFAGTWCAQTHIPYALLVAGLGALVVGGLAQQWRHQRDEAERGRLRRWVGGSAGLAALLWLPPLIEQVRHHPGNLAVIVENFRHPYDDAVPLGDAFGNWIRHLDLHALLTSGRVPNGWVPGGQPLGGAVSLLAWLATAGLAVRGARRHQEQDGTLVRLHLVVGVAVVLGLVATARIFGPLWPYLVLWAWGTTALMATAIAWTLLDALPRLPLASRWSSPRAGRIGAGALVAVAAVIGVGLTVDAARTELPSRALQAQVDTLADDVVEALAADPVGCGEDCRYVLTWRDVPDAASQSLGLLDRLVGEGYDAGLGHRAEATFVSHHVVDPDEADAILKLVIGPAIVPLRERSNVRQVAFVDPNSPADQAERRALIPDLLERLEDEGYRDLAERLGRNPYLVIPTDPGMSPELVLGLFALDHYRPPVAVVLIAPTALR